MVGAIPTDGHQQAHGYASKWLHRAAASNFFQVSNPCFLHEVALISAQSSSLCVS